MDHNLRVSTKIIVQNITLTIIEFLDALCAVIGENLFSLSLFHYDNRATMNHYQALCKNTACIY